MWKRATLTAAELAVSLALIGLLAAGCNEKTSPAPAASNGGSELETRNERVDSPRKLTEQPTGDARQNGAAAADEQNENGEGIQMTAKLIPRDVLFAIRSERRPD